MNIVYIIGNGLDLAQGLKTSYADFYKKHLKKNDHCSPLLDCMRQDIESDKELWSDMEFALGLYTSKIQNEEDFTNLYYELSDNLQEYLKQQESSFSPTDELKHRFLDDFIKPTKYIADSDRNRLKSLNLSVPIDISVISLNYTNTLQKLLSLERQDKVLGTGINLRQIIHVHGKLRDTIIIGVDNESQIGNELFKKNENVKDLIVKEQSNTAMKNTMHRTCDRLLREAQLVVLYGVSIGDTDARWWNLLGNQLKSRNNLYIIRHLYTKEKIPPTRLQRYGIIERNEQRVLLQKMGFEEGKCSESIKNRLFFIINSKNFL